MIKKFIPFYKPRLKRFISVLVVAVCISIIDLLIPNLTSNLINNAIGNNDLNLFYKIGLIMLGLYILRVIFTYFVTLHGHMVGVSIEFEMRKKLFDKITKLPIKFFDENSTGSLMSRITVDLNEISEIAHHGPEELTMLVILVTGSLALMFNMNVKLATIILILVPLVYVINQRSRKKFFNVNLKMKESLARINSSINETFSGIRIVKSYTNESFEVEKFDKGNNGFFNEKKSFYAIMASYMSSFKAYFGVLNLVVIIYGAYLVIQNEMNVGKLTAFIMYVNLFEQPINRFSNFVTEYHKAASGYHRYLDVMEQPEQIDYKDAKVISDIKGKIEFKNVSFKYDKDSDYVLENFNLIVNPGEKVALVGASGAGKTTVCNLLNRFYEIDSGEILIDGINIKNISLQSLRSHIGYVTQDNYIFSGSIFDNVIYGDFRKSKQDVINACEMAKLTDVIASLPEQYNSNIGERGIKLSGGQRQRLSLSRVFLKNPTLMVLDEATSALDNKTEKEIQAVLEKLEENRTSLIVAHRLTTVENADKIVVIGNKGIIEEGNHKSLMELKKAYFALYNVGLTS
ncbi:ABC transporter ATP-binding protein [Mycoplasma sp. P36-A1]|uniref:ABC transporter ATP-binding protein n=1 Tax=Mycoplasma sp. P36-A1 TaxID=3252900 RepID=UPI003C30DE8A